MKLFEGKDSSGIICDVNFVNMCDAYASYYKGFFRNAFLAHFFKHEKKNVKEIKFMCLNLDSRNHYWSKISCLMKKV